MSTHGASFVEVSKLVRVFEVVGNGIIPEPESMVGVGAWAMVYNWGMGRDGVDVFERDAQLSSPVQALSNGDPCLDMGFPLGV